MNLVLLKNIAITGIHWGAYGSAPFCSICPCRTSLTRHSLEFEPERIPVVWKDLLEYVPHVSTGNNCGSISFAASSHRGRSNPLHTRRHTASITSPTAFARSKTEKHMGRLSSESVWTTIIRLAQSFDRVHSLPNLVVHFHVFDLRLWHIDLRFEMGSSVYHCAI